MKSFTIYKEYFDLITLLPTEEEQEELLFKIADYMFNNKKPILNDNQMKIFNNLKRPLDKSKSKSKATSKQNQKEIKIKSKQNQKENTSNDVNVNVSNYDSNYVVNVNVNLYEFIESNFGRTLNPIEYEEVSTWDDNDLTRYAIKQAVLNNVYSIKYIKAILKNWESKDIKTVQQAQKTKKKTADVPEWFDEKNEKQSINEKEEKKLKELISNYE